MQKEKMCTQWTSDQ